MTVIKFAARLPSLPLSLTSSLEHLLSLPFGYQRLTSWEWQWNPLKDWEREFNECGVNSHCDHAFHGEGVERGVGKKIENEMKI